MKGPVAWLDASLALPAPVQGRPGDPGLFGPSSAVWTIGRERILLVGGPAALLLQVAHPLIAAAVAEHSSFGADPMKRLRATLEVVLAIAFGDRSQAEAAARSVRAVHGRVRGSLNEPVGRYPAGATFDASDPGLGLWVHATLVWSALETYDRFVGRLGPAARERYWQETKAFAGLFGVSEPELPASHPDFEAYFGRMVAGGDLAVGPQARALAARIVNPPVPGPLRPAVRLTRLITERLLPDRLRTDFGFPSGGGSGVSFPVLAGSLKLVVRALPPGARFWPHYGVARSRASGV
jgi:uncharacterized protein (DUF2236 family)